MRDLLLHSRRLFSQFEWVSFRGADRLAGRKELRQCTKMPLRVLLWVLFVFSQITACATVKPSQRQILSQPEMDPSKDKLEETFHSHVEAAREAGAGGHGAAGGGCGCG